jgi:hypothetical protein
MGAAQLRYYEVDLFFSYLKEVESCRLKFSV